MACPCTDQNTRVRVVGKLGYRGIWRIYLTSQISTPSCTRETTQHPNSDYAFSAPFVANPHPQTVARTVLSCGP